jgi:hypothetical protein
MSVTQLFAIAALPVLCLTMFFVYRASIRLFGRNLWLGVGAAWYSGFPVYWPIWCVVFPLCLLGLPKIAGLFTPRGLTPVGLVVFLFPIMMTLLGRHREGRPGSTS